jgi:hypothetical protein
MEMEMKIIPTIPIREFEVGFPGHRLLIKDCAHIDLEDDEQVTFTTSSGSEYDVVRKSWGYFATPSINQRLKKFGLRAVLIQDSMRKRFICLVEDDKEEKFQSFLDSDGAGILCWLDDDDSVEKFI